ncbi:DUF5708 family protein [Embleya sp. NBC_00896]|uniref:DUF5708 family protein n=1 Tax=Embleya sp. NBC_00896 TaxID=2975961 RepID=UPI0038631FF4|nr:DUF5708 family protein [Embleya sp. NBC_00896]
MTKARSSMATGLVSVVVGGLLKLFADGVDTPVVSLGKIGVVLLVVGIAELLYGLYLMGRDTRKA